MYILNCNASRYFRYFWPSDVLKNNYFRRIKLQLSVKAIITRRMSSTIGRVKKRRVIARSTLKKNALAHTRRGNRLKKGIPMTAQRKIRSSRRDGDRRVSFVNNDTYYIVTTHYVYS